MANKIKMVNIFVLGNEKRDFKIFYNGKLAKYEVCI